MRCPVATRETQGLMASAHECFEAWRSHFETDAWRADAKGSMRSVSAIYFHWAGEGAISRPVTDVQFERLVGISSSYQYFMLREGEVLMRPHSCWCPACFDVAVAGPGRGTRLTSEYEVRGCAKTGNSFYAWHNGNCRAKSGVEASSPDQRARERGHTLAAAGLEPGQWVLVEAFCDCEDEMWLGKTLSFGEFDRGSCCKRHDTAAATVYGTRFNTGDFMVAVQWYERLSESGNGERREFIRGKRMLDVINSTELRMAGFEMVGIGSFPPDASGDADALKKWELPRDVEAEALTWCR